MVKDISETGATGPIAQIFDEVRALYGVAYVSAIHRIMAGRPGFLEWAWEATAPAFRSGAAQEAGWRCADSLEIPTLEFIPTSVLELWGINASDRTRVCDVCASFVRVAPVNMVFAALVTQRLSGAEPGGLDGPLRADWTPPDPIQRDLVGMVDLDDVDPALHGTITVFASDMGGAPFVPGLYRMLAHWPNLLAHLAVVLPPRLASPGTVSAFDTLRARVDAAAAEVLAGMPKGPSSFARPTDADRRWFRSVSQTYRGTSPEMVVAGRLIGQAIGR